MTKLSERVRRLHADMTNLYDDEDRTFEQAAAALDAAEKALAGAKLLASATVNNNPKSYRMQLAREFYVIIDDVLSLLRKE